MTTQSSPAVWVVIPTYNEADNVGPMAEALMALPVSNLHLLFVDDESPDGTGALADELSRRFAGRVFVMHRQGQRGFARAYIEGFLHVLALGADVVVQMDCDFSHQPQDIPRLLEALKPDVDMVVGSRYTPGGGTDPRWGVGRKLLSGWANFYARTILWLPIQDATGGFRAWNGRLLRMIDFKQILSQGYVFQVEMTYVAYRLGSRIVEVPIFFPDRRVGQSKMSLKLKIEAALRVWEVLWRHRRLSPAARRATE